MPEGAGRLIHVGESGIVFRHAVKEVPAPRSATPATASLRACVATVVELPAEDVPEPRPGENPALGFTLSRWLGGRGLGIARVADPASFAWAGPWIARLGGVDGGRYVVMYGVPSGVVWDPVGGPPVEQAGLEDGFLIAAGDIALALPELPGPPAGDGSVVGVYVARSAGEPARSLTQERALAGLGLDGDRHAAGTGTFPSGVSGSALTLIAAEVCESFDPPLGPDDHRRNLVTRGIDLNGLVGREFLVGEVRCAGRRLCEPCTVVQRYAGRPVLRALVHRGGLRADILTDGTIRVGDPVRVDGSAAG